MMPRFLFAGWVLCAALWAQQGLTSRPDVLECKQGFALTLSPDFRPGWRPTR